MQFAEYIQANLSLYQTRNAHTLQPPAIASFTRNELARALRSRNPYTVNLLLGGVTTPSAGVPFTESQKPVAASTTSAAAPQQQPEPPTSTSTANTAGARVAAAPAEKPRPKLYWLDYLATLAEVPYAAHGYAQYYCLSTLDKHHHPGMSRAEGLSLLNMCADELKRRLPIDYKGLSVKIVTAEEGVREVGPEEWKEELGVLPA